MSHCSEPDPMRDNAAFLKQFRTEFPVTKREWPEGRIDATDDSACKMAVAVKDGRVIIAFDRPMDWIGFNPKQASELADTIIAKSMEARGIKS